MSAEEGRYWIVGMSTDHLLVGRYEWGRAALLGKFPVGLLGVLDVEAFSKALACMVRDYVRIHAPGGCRNPVELFERHVPERYGERIAIALYQADVMKTGGVKLPEGHVKMLVDALTGEKS